MIYIYTKILNVDFNGISTAAGNYSLYRNDIDKMFLQEVVQKHWLHSGYTTYLNTGADQGGKVFNARARMYFTQID